MSKQKNSSTPILYINRLSPSNILLCREKGKGNMLSNRPKADLEQLQFNFFITTVDNSKVQYIERNSNKRMAITRMIAFYTVTGGKLFCYSFRFFSFFLFCFLFVFFLVFCFLFVCFFYIFPCFFFFVKRFL